MATVETGIVYSTVPGHRPLALDLYLPPAPRAVCIYLHGGGWRRGTRRDGPGHMAGRGTELLVRLADHGIGVAACDYRLSSESQFPAQLDDVLAACAFVRDEVVDHGLGGLPMSLFGQSAGAHLAALAALDERLDPPATAAVCWATPTDLLGHPDDLAALGIEPDRGPDSREALLLGAPAHTVPDDARAASPVHRVRPTPTRFLLVHGADDRHVPIAQGRRLEAALVDAGVDVAFVSVDAGDHFFAAIEPERVSALVDTTAAFILDDRP